MGRVARHGHALYRKSSPTYRSWEAMKRRCLVTHSSGYRLYGAKGIKVCPRWMSFDLFLEDMGERPPGHSIDRIDGTGDYEPSNCRWADTVTQSRNRKFSPEGMERMREAGRKSGATRRAKRDAQIAGGSR